MSDFNAQTPSLGGETLAAGAVQNEIRALAEPIGPVEIAQALPEQAEGVGEMIRQSAELTLESARTSYDRMRAAAEEATANLEEALACACSGVAEMNLKAIEAVKSSTDAVFELAGKMAGVTTVADLLALQAEHFRRQVETASAQAQEFAELARKVSAQAVAPLSDTLAKTFGAAA
jgi:phasin